jgi:hypothetical protein
MTNDKKQTALTFFLMGLIDLEIGKGISTDKVIELHYLFDQAKAMEEQQAFEFWQGGIKCTDEGGKSFDKYYNETYKQP